LIFGILGGLVGVAVGAGLWALITVITDYQIGWMAIGVGFLVGLCVRYAGQGLHMGFGLVGGVLALVGCLLGNLLSGLIFVAQEFEVPFLEVLRVLNIGAIAEVMTIMFSPIDLLFYGLAIYAGYQNAFRRLTDQDLAN